MAGVIAAALVNLRRRQRLLNAAVEGARRLLPGALDPATLQRFDVLRAQGKPGAAMEVLGFGPLHELCSRVAPDECRQVEQEIVAAAAVLESREMVPVPPGDSSGGDGGEVASAGFRVRPGFVLPEAVVRLPQWEGWLRRLRDAVIAWQLERQREERQQRAQQAGSEAAPDAAANGSSEAAPDAAANGSSDGPGSTAAGAVEPERQPAVSLVTGAPPGSLHGSFSTTALAPLGQLMTLELRVAVAPPGGRLLLHSLRQTRKPLGPLGDVVLPLAAANAAPEPSLEAALETAAWRLVRLPPSLAFSCSLLPDSEAPAAEGAAEGAGAGAPAFEFGGGHACLLSLAMALAWLTEREQAAGAESLRGVWVPSDGRVRVQLAPTPGVRWPWRRGSSEGAAPAPAYRLQVWPPAADGGWSLAPGEANDPAVQAEVREADLSGAQLAALLDCLDAFGQQHPGLMPVMTLDGLEAPPA